MVIAVVQVHQAQVEVMAPVEAAAQVDQVEVVVRVEVVAQVELTAPMGLMEQVVQAVLQVQAEAAVVVV